MDKTVAGMIGAVAALTATASQAAVPAPQAVEDVLRADTYADLLKPIANARALLASPTRTSPIEQVQLVVIQHHHHHHYRRRRHYHHHHHHHHNHN